MSKAITDEQIAANACKVGGCSNAVHGYGLCRSHWRFNKLYGNPLKRRLASHVSLTQFIDDAVASNEDECILWPYGTKSDGYPQVTINGVKWVVGRLVLKKFTGSTPPNCLATHGSCNNPLCINPRHLSWGTPQSNMQDKERDGTVQLGSENPAAKLTESKVRTILSSGESAKYLAQSFGVSSATINRIKNRSIWSHVPLQGADNGSN